jgi:hypothetical protein
LLHDTVFVVPYIVLQLFHSWSLLSNLPSTLIETSLLHYKLHVYTANTALHFHFFFNNSPHLAFVGFVSSFLCQCLHLIGLIPIQHLLFYLLNLYLVDCCRVFKQYLQTGIFVLVFCFQIFCNFDYVCFV